MKYADLKVTTSSHGNNGTITDNTGIVWDTIDPKRKEWQARVSNGVIEREVEGVLESRSNGLSYIRIPYQYDILAYILCTI
jgi:hypothetical protein